MDTAKLTRLPPDFKYHASSLKKPCNMPMLFSARYPEIHPPGTLKTLGGTAGHTIMELWLLDKGIVAADGTPLEIGPDTDLEMPWFAALCDAAGKDTAKSGREWPDPKLEDYAAETAGDYANQIRGFMQWWIAGRFELIFVEANYDLQVEGGSKDTAPYQMEGRIDLCFRDVRGVLSFPGAVILADWKFGKIEKMQNQDQWVLDMHFQLSTYSLGMWKGKVAAMGPDGQTIHLTDMAPDLAGLILMDDFKPYEKRTSISYPSYSTESRRLWLEERSNLARGRAKETELELRTLVADREAVATQYPNNKQKVEAAETARRKLASHLEAPVLYHEPGWMRGPGFHGAHFTPTTLENHRLAMRGRMASTRMGVGLYRVITDSCTFCFWKNVCLKDWHGEEIDVNDKSLWDMPEDTETQLEAMNHGKD